MTRLSRNKTLVWSLSSWQIGRTPGHWSQSWRGSIVMSFHSGFKVDSRGQSRIMLDNQKTMTGSSWEMDPRNLAQRVAR